MKFTVVILLVAGFVALVVAAPTDIENDVPEPKWNENEPLLKTDPGRIHAINILLGEVKKYITKFLGCRFTWQIK